MIVMFLLLQVTSVNQTGGITTDHVDGSVVMDSNGQTTVNASKKFRCKNGDTPELPGKIISRCRAEFLGLPSNTAWYNPYPGVVIPYDGRCNFQTEWPRRRGGDGMMYDDGDLDERGRPRPGSKPCSKGY